MIKSISLFFLFCLALVNTSLSQISFPFGNSFLYLKGSQASSLPTNWYKPEYTPFIWSESEAPFYYGAKSGTLLSDMQGNYSTLYLRTNFTVSGLENINEVNFLVNYDDGFVVWINGQEAFNRNAPTQRTANSLAPTYHESGANEKITIPLSNMNLLVGSNLLAIQIFNSTLNSSDLYFDISINAQPELPVYTSESEVTFSHLAGFYNEPFSLVLDIGDDSTQVVYTLDGSNPQTSANAITVTPPAIIFIHPDSTAIRPATPVVMVRASLVGEGFAPSVSKTKSYIFIDKVLTQKHPGGDWPKNNVNGQFIDLEMDSEVVNHNDYKNLIKEALLDIPSISVVTELDNLFDPASGIYVNATQRGIEWERPCSVELLNTTDSGFQINAGLRIRGGNSRKTDNPKHAFRLFFREEYGASKLKYPLFGDEGVAEFDKIDLRTEQNYSWSMDGDNHNTFLRDVFSRDLQGAFNQPYTRSRYYHLYLNGMYWGLFQTEERPEADFAASYLGGDDDDYDVIKVASENWPYVNEATAGTMDAWAELYTICNKSSFTETDYFQLEGKDALGKPAINSKVLVNIDNLIDYMLTVFYTGNVDAPVSAWYSNNMPNNYFALYNHDNIGQGFVFVGHDAEHSMFIDPIYVSDGINENRVTIDDPAMKTPNLDFSNPQWLHYKLCMVEAYRLRFADRASFWFSNQQPLSTEKGLERFNIRKNQIDMAIIGESARWGDAMVSTPRTRNKDWLPEVTNLTNKFFPKRGPIVINQLKNAGLYPELLNPVVSSNTAEITGETSYFENEVNLIISHTNASGKLYYTTDGTDPRNEDGTMNYKAIQGTTDVALTITSSTQIKVRVKNNDDWSGLRQISFLKNTEDYSGLKLTEIHYHPWDLVVGTDTTENKDLEFIELKNEGTKAINISGIIIDSAVYYQVPEATLLNPGAFYVIASKPKAFYTRYGRNPHGNFTGNLDNSGEYLLITDPKGNKILSCTYDDQYPWPEAADGMGFSLAASVTRSTQNPDEPAYWKKSEVRHGSPFDNDTPIETNEELVLETFPNPTHETLNIKVDHLTEAQTIDISVVNQMGKTVYSNQLEDTNLETINFTSLRLTPGTYIVKITTKTQNWIQKVIYL
ncbi:MAG TPA: hypothetical protein DCQ26_14315 [Marinilabiliales bacterium]|nr:MAG: hypothetical protein A2W96_16370 [Bacteroidetes bacterium GWD2_40_43]OFX90276.1 MAG: hypothetical protein A2W97_17420 [Bacteroidetes bacterium GWE2_40_63]OFY22114.1 MAG: hypothetical protein A2W88_09035 [Bacteroidetes bacterium GWF2_40_13]HAM99777.1 hypothetical protein [Marinilabiliales bacterium]HBO76207.1 hypothetical protein [Marinilabiliales bacterium]